MKLRIHSLSKFTAGLIIGFSTFCANAEKVISLEQAVALAQQNDPWLHGSKLKQRAVEYKSIASGTLPDPKMSIGLSNLPTDSWDLGQEGMTQIKVGVSQMFPRGDSASIKANQFKVAASKFPLLRTDRKAKLAVTIAELWLDAYLAQQTIVYIENDRALFEQMAEVAKANYSSAYGKTRQQDVIRAQLELVQLADRLAVEQQQLETAIARLNQWLHIYDSSRFAFDYAEAPEQQGFRVSAPLPSIALTAPKVMAEPRLNRNKLAQLVANHPAVLAIDVKQQVSNKAVTLAKQSYKPQWGVNASYGYRDNMPSGEDRADLFSVGVTFDLPLFTSNRQDKQVAASIAESESVKTEKLLVMQQMITGIEKERRILMRLAERQSLYQEQLLKQTYDQAEAALTAYTNDDGDFAEVVRARIAELNTRISALQIDVNALKAVARINYYFTQSNDRANPQPHQYGAQ